VSRVYATIALARADFLERTRQYQYVATIAVTLLVGALLVPAKDAGYDTFLIDGYRGMYNSPWVGATFAILTSLMLTLFGFYGVKSAIERDRSTRVGEILAATTLSRVDYTLGKTSSNFLVLGSMTAVLFVVAIIMQLVRGESTTIEFAQLALPIALVVLPAIAVVSAIAVLFEVIPWLRGGFGNVVYFFAWIAYQVGGSRPQSNATPWWGDLLGFNLIVRKVWPSLTLVDPHAGPDSVEIGASTAAARHLFVLHPIAWSGGDVAQRLAWFFVALGIVAIAAALFDRFANPARADGNRGANAVAERLHSLLERSSGPLVDTLFRGSYGAIVLAELRLLVRGLSPWWYAVAAGLWIAQLFANGHAESVVLGLAWLWPLLQWSQLGTREAVFATEQFIYPTLHPIRRQFFAQWLAGVLLALITAGGAIVHFAVLGNPVGIAGVVAGAVFVPTLALAFGALWGTTRLFEIFFLLLWYVGPMNGTAFDFTQGANAVPFTLTSALLLAVAIGARKLRLRYA
jgi:hypothetical protein